MKIGLFTLLLLPLSALAGISVAPLAQPDQRAQEIVGSENNDFDVIEDQTALQQATEISPFAAFEQFSGGLLQNIGLPQPQIWFNVNDLSNPNDWKRQFRYVIWINRGTHGPTAQSLQVWDNGRRVMAERVSTGLPPEHPTPTGYYSPFWLDLDHHASKYRNAPMPFAIFFNGDVAIHERPPGTQGAIGRPASHGCVRLTQLSNGYRPAARLFQMVGSAGLGQVPAFSRSGIPLRRPDGSIRTRVAYRTLIIVEDR